MATEDGIRGLIVEKLGTILIVDDTDIVLDVLVAILKRASFIVLVANSGPTALKVATSYTGKIDLLICDVKMPGMSGIDLAETLELSRQGIRVLLIGGEPMPDHRWTFIQKPFLPTRLLEMINVVLRAPDQTQHIRHFSAESSE